MRQRSKMTQDPETPKAELTAETELTVDQVDEAWRNVSTIAPKTAPTIAPKKPKSITLVKAGEPVLPPETAATTVQDLSTGTDVIGESRQEAGSPVGLQTDMSERQGHGHKSNHIPQDYSPRRIRLVAFSIIMLFGTLFAIGMVPRIGEERQLRAAAREVHLTVPGVNVVVPTVSFGEGDILLPSNVQAIEETTVYARTSGYLKQRYVDIGSHVQAGQLLALIDAPEADQQVLQAEADTAKARAVSGQASADVIRLRATVVQALSEIARSQSTLQQAKADQEHQSAKLEQAQSAINVARAKLAQARQILAARNADLIHSQAQFDLARKTLSRWKELEKVEAVSGQEVDEKQAAFDVSQANVSAARAAVNSAQSDSDALEAVIVSTQAESRAAAADVKSGSQRINAAQYAIKSSEANLEATRANVSASQSNVAAMRASVTSAEASHRRFLALKSYERILAPFTGVITARNVDAGALITAGSGSFENDPARTVSRSGLFGIARTDTLRIQVNVPQSFVAAIKIGQKATVEFAEYPGKTFEGVIYRTAGALDAASRTLLTEIHLPNPLGNLMPGMAATVHISTNSARQSLRIPANTLIVDTQGTRVAIIDKDKRIHFQPVQIGRDFGKEMEIRSGLGAQSRLVVNPTDDLIEGGAVRIVENSQK